MLLGGLVEIESAFDSLTGVWDGVYTYPLEESSTGFTVTLLQLGDALSGTVHEIADIGVFAGKTIHAVIDGRRLSDHVVFIKTYEDLGPDAEYGGQVIYEGIVSDDGLRIEGRWKIPRAWSGDFMMVRPGRVTEAARRGAVEIV